MFMGVNVSLYKNCMTHITFLDVKNWNCSPTILRTLSGRAPQVMIHGLGLFVAPYLLRQLSRSPCFPPCLTYVSSFLPSNRYPGFNSHNSHKYMSLLFFAHPSALHMVQPTNVVCLIKYAFVRHFRADLHVGMHQRSVMKSIRSNERCYHWACAPCLLQKCQAACTNARHGAVSFRYILTEIGSSPAYG